MRKYALCALAALLTCTACRRQTPQQEVHRIMREVGITLAIAENCTGGEIAARFTELPGASAYFKCGVVAYSNEAIHNLLEVDMDTILRYGAVSEQVAREMAEGVLRITRADYAVATTGIAGPTGGTAETPVGTVWIAVATPAETYTVLYRAGDSRNEVIDRASAYAIEMLLEELPHE